MKEWLSFDDVLIVPKFSEIESRKDVDFYYHGLNLPVLSSNMDTVTGHEMANAVASAGGMGCLHRFCSIEENVEEFKKCLTHPIVSIGLGNGELERAEALHKAGAGVFVIDVANGAQMSVVNQAKKFRELFGYNAELVVGNFASLESVDTFLAHISDLNGIKIGIGPGSACSTRIKTGVGIPQFQAIWDIAKKYNGRTTIIADGGMRSPGDIAKAIGAGAHLVMLGGMLAGTDEAPGEKVWRNNEGKYLTEDIVYPLKKAESGLYVIDRNHEVNLPSFKKYRGSASKESYVVQNKDASWRTAEGESFYVPCKGPVKEVLKDIEGGLRSAFSYVGAKNMVEFHEKCEFVQITNAGYIEGTPHGKGK